MPRFRPLGARAPSDIPRRLDKASRDRYWEDEQARQRRCGVSTHWLDAAQMAPYRLRIILAGGIAGAGDQYGVFGAHRGHSAGNLEARIENNIEVPARLTDWGMDTLFRTAPSRVELSDNLRDVAEWRSGRRSWVPDEQRRSYNGGRFPASWRY